MATNGEAEGGGAKEQPLSTKNAKRVSAIGKRSSDRSYSRSLNEEQTFAEVGREDCDLDATGENPLGGRFAEGI